MMDADGSVRGGGVEPTPLRACSLCSLQFLSSLLCLCSLRSLCSPCSLCSLTLLTLLTPLTTLSVLAVPTMPTLPLSTGRHRFWRAPRWHRHAEAADARVVRCHIRQLVHSQALSLRRSGWHCRVHSTQSCGIRSTRQAAESAHVTEIKTIFDDLFHHNGKVGVSGRIRGRHIGRILCPVAPPPPPPPPPPLPLPPPTPSPMPMPSPLPATTCYYLLLPATVPSFVGPTDVHPHLAAP